MTIGVISALTYSSLNFIFVQYKPRIAVAIPDL